MGNLADSRRRRIKRGLHPDNIGTGKYTKQEADYIPFLGDNPSGEKPAIYTARFRVTDGTIELEAKRSGGRLHITCEAEEKHNRAIFECVEAFVKAIFDGTAREIKEAEPEDSTIMKLKKELAQTEKERDEAKAKVRSVIGMLDES